MGPSGGDQWISGAKRVSGSVPVCWTIGLFATATGKSFLGGIYCSEHRVRDPTLFRRPRPTTPPHPRGYEPRGAVHSSELQYVFGMLSPQASQDADRKLSAQMQEYWTNYAKTGNPNGGTPPVWPKEVCSAASEIRVFPVPHSAITYRCDHIPLPAISLLSYNV